MRNLFSLILILCSSVLSAAPYYRFDHLTAVDGLSQSEVYSFCKSRTGHIWIGTLDGLNRYDGDEIVTFNPDVEDEYAVVGSTIHTLAEDELLRLWVGTNSGLSLFDTADERFYTIPLADNIVGEEVKVLRHHKGILYVGTTHRLYMIDTEQQSIPKIRESVVQIPLGTLNLARNVSGINIDSEGGVWCLTEQQLYTIKGSRAEFVAELPSCGWAVAMSIDRNDQIWVASFGDDGALVRYNIARGVSTIFRHKADDASSLSSNNVSDIAFDHEGAMWVATRDKGLNRATAESLTGDRICFEHINGISLSNWGLNTSLVYSLYFSDEVLWVGAIGGGVNYHDFNSKPIGGYLTPKSSALVRSVYATGESIYLGIQGDGLHHINRKSREIRKIESSHRTIFHIENIDSDRYWICSGGGLSLEHITPDGVKHLERLLESSTFHITRSSDRIWWAATFTGLFRIDYFDGQVHSIEHYSDSTTPALSHNNCRVVRYDPILDRLWIGTEGGGVNSITLNDDHRPLFNTKFTQTGANSLSSNFVRDICVQDRNRVWVGTYEGLNLINIDNTQSYKIDVFKGRDGLMDNTIQSIRDDERGNIWVSTNKGISSISNGEYQITNYLSSDGLHGLEFAEHCSAETTDGELLFAGIGGVTAFYAEHITPAPQRYNLSIVGMNLLGEPLIPDGTILSQPIYLTQRVDLQPHENDFEFKFSAMSFLSADKIIYSYRLLGYDDEWRTTTSSQRTATYTNIGHGEYTFQVRAMDEAGCWSETKSLIVDIETPLYMEWYMLLLFATLSIAALSLGVTLFYKMRKHRLMQTHRDELYELEQSRVRFYINMSHDLQTPLTLILGPLNQLITKYKFEESVEDKLSLINRNAKKLLEMIGQILEIRKAEIGALQIRNQSIEVCTFVKERMVNFRYAFKDKGLKFDLKCETDKLWTLVDTDILDKVLYNIISNALKYTDHGGVSILVRQQSDKILISVKDSGRGIAADQLEAIFVRFYNNKDMRKGSYGIGLSHCREMAKLISGEINVESEFGAGSTFTISIPVIEIESEEIVAADPQRAVEMSGEPTPTNRPTLLIVEDEADMREYILSIFDGEYNVLQATNGEEGLAMLHRESVDIVVSDVVMPKMNGVEMTRAVKSSEELKHTPVILLTALKGEHARYQGLETGADDYLNKPFDERELLLKVRNILTTKRSLTDLFNAQFMLKITPAEMPSYDAEFMQRVIEYMEQHYFNPNFSIEDLESQMAMSHASFYRRIKSITGVSMKELLTNYRLERARILVTQSDMRIAEIAIATGFNSSSYFSNCFKKKYGSIALEYRKEAVENELL